jgi:hypothetical protein
MTSAYLLLVVVHVLLFAYWLGADWGVYVTSRYVADPKLSLEERRRFLQAAFRIDLLPRISFTLLLPVGVQLAAYYGAWPFHAAFVPAVWVFAIAWMILNVAGYLRAGTPIGDRIRGWDQYIRLVLAPVLIAAGLWSAIAGQPIAPLFIALKVMVFGCMIIVGLILRAIMKNWAIGFRRLATEGPSAAVDAIFQDSLARARYIAYFMWSLSGVMAVLGVTKPA